MKARREVNTYLAIIGGLALLAGGADLLVRGSVAIAKLLARLVAAAQNTIANAGDANLAAAVIRPVISIIFAVDERW